MIVFVNINKYPRVPEWKIIIKLFLNITLFFKCFLPQLHKCLGYDITIAILKYTEEIPQWDRPGRLRNLGFTLKPKEKATVKEREWLNQLIVCFYLSFKNISINVYLCFAYMYVGALHACLVIAETRRGCQNLWSRVKDSCEELCGS